mmetsp:Transcript_16233/g.17524  ORF Transcript_16233/g.17524 Transcript_16233/m.17524 type:complete len:110 (-) Transcript_16233:130-459(-)
MQFFRGTIIAVLIPTATSSAAMARAKGSPLRGSNDNGNGNGNGIAGQGIRGGADSLRNLFSARDLESEPIPVQEIPGGANPSGNLFPARSLGCCSFGYKKCGGNTIICW